MAGRLDAKQATLLHSIMVKLVGPESMRQLEEFMVKYEGEFEGGSEEHKLSHTGLHEEYSAIVEGMVERHLRGAGTTTDDFYEMCREAQASQDPAVDIFVQLVSASTDFPVFADLMRSRDKRKYFFQVMKMWASTMDQKSSA